MADLERRAFFKRGLKKATEKAVLYADKKVQQKAIHWFRPPYASDELDFLLLCSRCQDCISACPHQVLFPLPAQYGASVVKTPAMDLLNKACHLCENWPCVNACQTGALRFPKIKQNTEKDTAQPENNTGTQNQAPDQADMPPPALPKLAVARIDTQNCLPWQGPECGACRSACPVEAALKWDMTKPLIDPEKCCGCALCRDACITRPAAIHISRISVTRRPT